ncbi:M3 family metallopeptidase [Chitinimonas sp. BJB300]|uniref:M3 family metallopeptidase n=1 Tax=Chitinimonas sp. BJB300 TaxID=1559339 RepID=UPI000C108105|nr:M3 family metallopeptidase [Chitinimonas sp. BJB300]PHV10644.1 Zn-dependent oligopeptidase [Chitinimonas sp. BJB300]TSJ83807.1 Zn-dependent oligopeptidase [Chitinimonas sp. BJB300]
MKKLTLLVLAALSSAAWAGERGEIRISAAADVPTLCTQAIAKLNADVTALEKLPLSEASVITVLAPWNQTMTAFAEFNWGGGLIANVHPDEKVRQAEEACELKASAETNRIMQSSALYARFKAIKPADTIDAETLKAVLAEFEDKGVNLPEAKRKQAAKLFSRLDKLQQDFARNVRENKQKLSFTAEQLQGVSTDALASFKRDSKGNYLVGFDYPEYLPVIEGAESGETRQRLQYAYTRRGGNKNLAILQEVVQIRKQLASLLGYPSYAAWATRNNMVGKPEVVLDFLAKVKDQVGSVEKHELAELTAEKAAFTGDPKAKLERWDQMFYERRLQKAKFQVDQEMVRAQFPSAQTVEWMMAVTSRLYDVEFRPNAKLPVWHEDVKGYDVFDKASGEYLSSFYMDLYPRDGKYKHAAAFSVRQASVLTGTTPASVLVTNFNRKGFDQDELETLFHEFGHIMHGVLSRTRYGLNAGTNTKRDFVEAPSQMYEEWARNPASLALWNEVCPSCQPIDMKLIEKMNAARLFGQGTKYARQWLYAAYDMALAGPIPQKPQALWQRMEGATALGYVKGTEFPGAFGHIVGGYAAGYYGYMWSEVLALDMRSAFGSNVMDPEVGMRFRKTVLENGSQVPEMDLVRKFLGREPSSDAFFREITGHAPAVGG